jgi:hypothetical protein
MNANARKCGDNMAGKCGSQIRVGRPRHLTQIAKLLSVAVVALAAVRPIAGADLQVPLKLTAAGTVTLEGGKPAAGAIVSYSGQNEPRVEVHADASGRYKLSAHFGINGRLYVHSADGSQAASRFIAAAAARTELARPIDIKLSPAKACSINVITSDGRPVAEAHVAFDGSFGVAQAITGSDATAKIALPMGDTLRAVAAWHPTKGAAGILDKSRVLAGDSFQLALMPTAPHTIRVVDSDGRPVSDFPFGVDINAMPRGWPLTEYIDAAQLRTDADGEVTVPWFPKEFGSVFVREACPDWKIDEIAQRDKENPNLTIVHARHKVAVRGRLKMPAGESAAGILIDSDGSGFTHIIDAPTARAAADGSFTLFVAPNHGYGLHILDSEWTSSGWSGLILADENSTPAEISMDATRATPLEVRVARGPEPTPVAGAWIYASADQDFTWRDSRDQKRSGSARALQILRTDANGVARAGVGQGKLTVRVSDGMWDEEQKINVESDHPPPVKFYRPWVGDRKVVGHLTVDGTPYKPSPSATIKAVLDYRGGEPLKASLHEDGSFEVLGDADKMLIYVSDAQRHVSAFVRTDPKDSEVTLPLLRAGVLSGVLVDHARDPVAGETLQLYLLDEKDFAAQELVAMDQVTSIQGRFDFDLVPANLKLALVVRRPSREHAGAVAVYSIGRYFFAPGEKRETQHLSVDLRSDQERTTAEKPPAPLAERLALVVRNVHPSGMNGLVIFKGDASEAVTKLVEKITDWDEHPDVLAYLPLVVTADELKAGAAVVEPLVQSPPQAGEAVLVALDGEGRSLGVLRLKADDPAGPVKSAVTFLKDHAPAMRDAQSRLAVAREDAKRTGRKVWLIESGPRCGPCFRLGRWMEQQHDLLEKDYVILKLMLDLDKNTDTVMSAVQEKREGVPWYAITDADGAILATSDGTVGNIGMPSSVEGIGHFRQMLEKTKDRLSTDEVDRLIKSLEEFK